MNLNLCVIIEKESSQKTEQSVSMLALTESSLFVVGAHFLLLLFVLLKKVTHSCYWIAHIVDKMTISNSSQSDEAFFF